jgi:O-antigen/teichoic acid export membrane protein
MPGDAGSRRRIVQDSAHYLTSTVVAQGLGLARTLLVPVLLGPAQLGIWNLMTVIVGYGANAHLGILHGLNKKIPFLRGQGRAQEIEDLRDSVWWANLLLGLGAGGSLLVASFLVAPPYASATRIVAVVVLLQMVYVYYFCTLRADSRFSLVSRGIALLSLLSSIFIVLLAYGFPNRLQGALWGLAISYVVVNTYWFVQADYRFTLGIKRALIAESFRIGLPLITLGIIDMFLLSLDRWLIAWKFSAASLGYYSIGIMASNLLGLVPASAANVLYPRMLERFAQTGKATTISGYLLHPVRAIAVLMALLVGAATILIPIVLHALLPKYGPSIPLLQILVPGAFFLGLTPVTGNYVIAINRQGALLRVQVAAIAVGLAIDLILLHLGHGVQGVAYGTLCCYAVYGVGYLYLALSFADVARGRIAGIIVEVFVLFGGTVAGLRVAALTVPGTGEHLLLPGLAQLTVFGAVLAPVLWLVHRRSGLVAALRAELGSLRRSGRGP